MPPNDSLPSRAEAVAVALPARPVAASLTSMTEYVLPTHANVLGNVFGGQILAWVDLCAAIAAGRHTGCMAITAGIDELSFEKPIKVGQVVRLTARVTAAFRTSIEILVEVEGEEVTTGARWPCVSAFVTFVALDAASQPTPAPPLLLTTDDERELARAATARRKHRLERRARSK
ncbi:MAG TPA: acyl-CoA thioesterase [Polyangiaceae bacterium]|nr:acyl-CoA thioesterase [Polyangiaceae bacterium]